MFSTRLRWTTALLVVVALEVVYAGPVISGQRLQKPVIIQTGDTHLTGSSRSEGPYRLPRHVLPSQYKLLLKPNLDPDYSDPVREFDGEVRILVEVEEATETITLHALNITISEASVKKRGEEENEINEELLDNYEFESSYHFLELRLKEIATTGSYIISINYTGILWDDMYGFYISTFEEGDEKKLLAATQFQATHARKAFPCFDEPSFKAQFEVTIIAPENMTVLGNMPEKSKSLSDGYQEVTFENTMIMSSYLLAFVVSPFEYNSDKGDGEGDVLFQTWARSEAVDWGQYSLNVSRKMLHTLEEYTNIKYAAAGINKVDQVALPDFAAGAMENWGLITYRETALLYNDGSADAKKRVATVIAHELLHMWFGNLVTTEWWDTTWLNEGFARFFQYYVTDKVEDTWNMWDQFLVDQHQMVFALDALETSKALTHNVSSPTSVSESFGSITYNKGASILRMISHIIGADNFQAALRDYLKENEFSTVRPNDLFEKLKQYAENSKLSAEEFEDFLISWTTTPGFPVINVKRDYENNKCSITQERFLLKGDSSQQYYVPITWTKPGSGFEILPPQEYLQPETPLEIKDLPSKDQWVVFNVQESGFYRVNYDEDNWDLLTQQLQSVDRPLDDIHVLNRAQLLDDAFNLARAGRLDYETAFRLADYLPREKEYVPWAAALNAFSYLDRMLVNHPKYPVLQRYFLRLLDNVFEQFHARGEIPQKQTGQLFINRILSKACSQNHAKCLESAKELFKEYIDTTMRETIPADIRSVVYCYGIKETEKTEWDELWTHYKESRDDVERGLMANGLACSKDKVSLNELLSHTIDGSIRKQDASSVFTAVYSNPFGVDEALNFLDESFVDIKEHYGSMGAINNIITGIAGRLTDEDQVEKFKTFLTYHNELTEIAKSAIEIAEDNIRWKKANEEKIFSILEEIELEKYRIPKHVTPQSYKLFLEPDFQTETFKGNVNIRIKAEHQVDTITLHSKSLTVNVTKVDNVGNNIYLSHSQDETLDFLYIHLKEALRKDSHYDITIKFEGDLRKDMYGFYVSRYPVDGEDDRKLAATQFQPTHARSVFPSFDEPTFKATFDVTIKTPPDYHALGNMPVKVEKSDGQFEFETTPEMSTYLLAFVVSDFHSQEDTESGESEVKVRTWAREEALPWANYSLIVTRDILETLEKFTDIPYRDPNITNSLTKVDQVALPDFSAGAMENWGLITYREAYLLYNEGTASARKSVATIIAHELAHMWFGNLVTTDWWDATWLNEGFAQYLQFFITDKVKPSWRLMDQFLVDHHQAVFASDSLVTSEALTAPAYTPAQVSARFSGITYSKGASILRMLSAMLGEDIFEEVLQTYLNKHSYSTTKPEDLFEQLVKKSPEAQLNDIRFLGLLRSWTEKPGFPVVKITRIGNSRSVVVEQTRFLIKSPAAPDLTLYYVPLTWTSEGGDFSLRAPQAYITNEQKSITTNAGAEPNKWIIFNVQETGYYRVNYDEHNWKLISSFLVDTSKSLSDIHVLNRAQLLDDAFNLARAGQLSYQTAIDISDYLPRETDYVPWASALAAFSYLQRMLIKEDRFVYLENYVLHLVKNVYSEYDFEDHDEHIDKLLLNRISAWACSLQHEHCINSASMRLTNYINDGEIVPADLRSVTYCYGIRHSSSEYWDRMWEKYIESKDNAERTIIMAGLACSHDETKLEQLLRSSINESAIRRQDASSVFTAVYGNSVGVDVALDFLDEHFDEVQEFYNSMGAINNIVVGLAGRLTISTQEEKMRTFINNHEDALGSTADSALEIVEENLQWISENADKILDYLENHTPPTLPPYRTTTTTTTTTTTQRTTTEGDYAPRITGSFALVVVSILFLCRII